MGAKILMLIEIECGNCTQTSQSSTYERLKPCLTFDRVRFQVPHDAEEHYNELKRVSARFRGLEPHTGQGYYREKWIEKLLH